MNLLFLGCGTVLCNVQSRFSNNKLEMNQDKTLFIVCVPPYYSTLVDNIKINIGSSDINVVSSVTNLGVQLDRKLKLTAQTSHLMSSSNCKDTGEEPSSLDNSKHTKHTHATRVQNTTLYSDGTTHTK